MAGIQSITSSLELAPHDLPHSAGNSPGIGGGPRSLSAVAPGLPVSLIGFPPHRVRPQAPSACAAGQGLRQRPRCALQPLPSPRLASVSFAGFAMASTAFPIVLHDHTREGIRWRVSIQPEQRGAGGVLVRFLKRGRHSKLLDQHCRWFAQGGWACGHAPSARVPQALRLRIEAELQRRHPPMASSTAQVPIHRGSLPGAAEAISCGGMSFSAFLAMELVEACLPDPFRRHSAAHGH